MKDARAAIRYAKALFSVGEREGKEKGYLEEMEKVASFLKQRPKVREFLTLPIFPKKEKKEVLESIKDFLNLSATMKSFMDVLFENNRIGIIENILENYQKLLDEKEGIKRGVVTTAFKLDKTTLDRVSESLAGYLGVKKVILSVQENKDVIGGIRVKVGDLVIDGSLKAQLRILKEKLLEG